MRKRIKIKAKRIAAGALAFMMAAGSIPAAGLQAFAKEEEDYNLDNGYLRVEVSEENGGFYISTVKGDKINKDDNNKNLLFHDNGDDTSFTSFQVTRGENTEEYIFGADYEGSSEVKLSKENGEIRAVWSVDDIEFTQTISLVKSGSSEHGMAYISYTAQNKGEEAQIRARILMDTALGYQDYAYYNIGSNSLIEQETTLGEDGYNKSFYGYNDPFSPTITSYIVNASVDNRECKPYQTIFAHWNNVASTVFDYKTDDGMTFTNPNNKKYLTADSAVALYYDLGTVTKDSSAAAAVNYGVFSNEKVQSSDAAAVNIIAPDVMELTADRTAYQNDGLFTIKTDIENIGPQNYDRVRVAVYTTSGITALNQKGEDIGATYDNPYTMDYSDFTEGQRQSTEWKFKAAPSEEGRYAVIHYKVYNISDDKTLQTGELLAENLIGEGSTYILCPGSVNAIPQIQFTSSSPEILYHQGTRNLYITGNNFSMLADQSTYQIWLERVDGQKINGVAAFEIPSQNIKIDTAKNTMTVVMTDEVPGTIPEGMYQLRIHYTQAGKEDITAPALRFQVKEDAKYKNDTYGLLVAEKSDDLSYHIRSYESEESYQAALKSGVADREKSLLEFRGVFTRKQEQGQKTVYTGISLGSEDNVMTLNNCLDIKDGTVTIAEDGNGVTVDFDAKLYTTGAGTGVWQGVCGLTALENGKDFGLIPYEENGERQDFNYETITLLWPSVGQAAQNLLGMLMDLKYGELGKIEHDNGDETRVVAFGAALSLNFLAKNIESGTDNKSVLGDAYNAAIHQGDVSAAELRAINKRIPYDTDTVDTDGEDDDMLEFSGSIQIDDVLFGGKYLGVCFTVELGIPAFVEGMPEVEGELTVKTVGNWEIGVSGSCDFDMFCLEAEIYIKSNGNIIVPDKFRIFLGNIKPGINVDGMGILWLQGAGGGIDNLYDTIFLTEAVPPLQLLIEAQFSLMQVISARASLELSLRGIGVELSEGKIANELEVLESARLQFDWYPEFYFLSSVNINILDAIVGGGYIVAEQSGFFEFFVHAALKVPDSVPVVGGMHIASAGLGANNDKLWGQVKVLTTKLGIVYYWGGDIDWGGGAAATPTYPELAGMTVGEAGDGHYAGDVPVYFDSETGKTLYMHTGTNISGRTGAEAVAVYTDTQTPGNRLQTLVGGKEHKLTLAAKQKDELLTIQWTAESEEAAKNDVSSLQISDADNGEKYELHLLDHEVNVEEQQDANANLTYDEQSGMAELVIAFTDSSAFQRTWKITTKQVSNVILYDLETMPEISEDTAVKVQDNRMIVNLKGTETGKYNKVLFTAVPKDETKESVLLYQIKTPVGEGEISFDLPYDLESGDYTLRITASDDESNYYSAVDKDFSYENPNQPEQPQKVTVQAGGNCRMQLDITKPAEDIDGYQVCVYDASGTAVAGLGNLMYTADGKSVQYDEDGKIIKSREAENNVSILAGGQYTYTDNETGEEKTVGLEEGKSYVAGIRTWKCSDDGKIIYSQEKRTKSMIMPEVTTTVIRVESDLQTVSVKEERIDTNANKVEFSTPYYRSKDLTFTVNAEDKITGTWKLDGGNREQDCGKITDDDHAEIALENLAQGGHTLEITGVNSHKDAVRYTYTFGIDSEGPKLLISSPVSGSVFDGTSGELLIQGLTEEGTKLTITDKESGKVYLNKKEVQTDHSGLFEESLVMDTENISHTLVVTAEDSVGNTTKKEIGLINSALGMIESLDIYSENMLVTNKTLSSGGTYSLRLLANLTDGRRLDITDSSLVEWKQNTIEGTAELKEENGKTVLRTGADATGMLTARFQISDAGAYSVSAGYKASGEVTLTDENTVLILPEENYYTGNEVKPVPKVYYKGTLLTEGVDYSIFYENNTEVTDTEKKAEVTITGQGNYNGNVTKTFNIIYLDSSDTYTVTEINGENGWYTTKVEITPKDGYEITDLSQDDQAQEKSGNYRTEAIEISAEGENVQEFRIRRISDLAVSDKLRSEIKIDRTAPTGSISLNEKAWNTFHTVTVFRPYRLTENLFRVDAMDAVSKVAGIRYFLAEDSVYADVQEMLDAAPDWQAYDSSNPPEAEEGKKQTMYVKITDMAGNVTYLNSDGILADTTAPVISGVRIKEDDSLKPLRADIAFTVNEAGTYYYALVPEGMEVPEAEQIISGETEAITGSGKVTEDQAGKEISITIRGLHKNTEYTLYVMAEDQAVNIRTGERDANRSGLMMAEKPVRTPDIRTEISEPEMVFELPETVFYTGSAITPDLMIKNGDIVLTEGVDYILTWENNVEISKENSAKVKVTGMGDYTGEKELIFNICYMSDEGTWKIAGNEGEDGWYRSAAVAAEPGYRTEPEITVEEGEQEISFRIRRTEDQALSDLITVRIKADYTSPQGTLTIAGQEWNGFREEAGEIQAGQKKYPLAITASDKLSGISSVCYAVSEKTYKTTDGLSQADLIWNSYEAGKSEFAAVDGMTVYVRIIDRAGNITYINSGRFAVDNSGEETTPGETPEETTPGETEMPGAVTTAAERMTEQTTKQEKTQETTQKRRETAKQEKSENTGDNAHTGIWLMILGFGTAGILAGRQRKKNVE